MTERSLRVLEFHKIRAELSKYCVSDMGKEKCEALVPTNRIADVRRMQQETEEARVVLTYLGGTPMISFADVRASLHLAEIGSALSPRALLDIAACLRAARAARDALNGVDPSGGAIYYFNPSTATSSWIWSRPLITVIGKHRFCS